MHVSELDRLPETVLGSTRVRFPIPASVTGGAYEVLEFRGEPGGIGPPRHLHRLADEAFIVLAGAIEIEVGGERMLAQAGTSVHVARGTPHHFTYAEPGTRFLAVLTPATRFDEYVPRLRALLAERTDQSAPPDAAKMAALMAEHDAYSA